MKTTLASSSPKCRASVILVILVFLGLMAVIIVSNNLALRHLDKSLRQVERKQMRQAGVAVKGKAPDK